jgi:uncharacterized protein YgbK (DUF1537 family)
MKMIVVADDFTGASDTGVQLAKKGARTEVMLTQQQKPSRRADVLVINTESRSMAAEQAAEAVSRALAPWQGQADLLIYKKIDSTFRGNVGAEIEAAMAASGKSLALIAAAIPAAGRTTRNGECLVHQTPLLDTEFASDPRTPIVSSRIQTLIGLQSRLPVYEITLDQVRDGGLDARLAQIADSGRAMVVLDAELDSDLAQIATAALALKTLPLLVGAAGLAGALPAESFLTARQNLPVLAVVGSMSEATRRQVEQARRQGRATVVDIDVESLLAPDGEPAVEAAIRQACTVLDSQHHCVLRTSRSAEDRDLVEALATRYDISRQELGERVSRRMGEVTLAILDSTRTGGLFLTGGDMATAVASALGAEGYRIQSEVAPCIPCGTFINSDIEDLPVITKAGGFGSDNTLCDALYFIEEMYRGH